MGDVLVVYCSRSGTTERLAERLATRLGADLERAVPRVPYDGARGYLRACRHSLLRRAPPVDCRRDPADYAAMVIGSPVWVGRLSTPVRSHLMRFRGRIGAVAAFWVSGSGARYSGVPAEIENLTGRALLATAHFGAREVDSAAADAKLNEIARALGTPQSNAA